VVLFALGIDKAQIHKFYALISNELENIRCGHRVSLTNEWAVKSAVRPRHLAINSWPMFREYVQIAGLALSVFEGAHEAWTAVQ
jgi:hypothetical protein